VKVAFVINHAAFFASHRLPIALEAMRRGHEVVLITGTAGSESMEAAAEARLRAHGIRHIRVEFTASGTNPLRELRGLTQVIRVMRRERPEIVHCASPKGILYGSIAARFARCRGVVIAVSGMGYAFTSQVGRNVARSLAAAAYRLLARFAYGHPNKRVIVQNTEDRELIAGASLARPEEIVLIPGSGVDLRKLGVVDIEAKSELVLFAGRMILDKGVAEFIDAARIVRRSAPKWRFVMAGAADYQNPTSISKGQLDAANAEGVVEWRGLVENMDSLYAAASIVCLPSYYREGMPKVLLEAAAAGCAVVTTDLPGCREAILPGRTGDLVPPRDAQVLADTLLRLIESRSRREKYGREGRKLAEAQFGIDRVVTRILELYDALLERAPRSAPNASTP
jgi:glycosyltransferase involved in cell wall biosynthesis